MHNSKNTILLVSISLICILAIFVLCWAVIGIKQKVGDTASTLSDVGVLEKNDMEYQISEKNIKLTQGDRAKIASYIVSKDGVVDFIKLIESIASKSNMEISIKTVRESGTVEQATSSPKVMLSLPLSVTGTWQNIMLFLALLESLPYRITLSKVDFRRIESEEVLDTKKKSQFSKSNPGWQGDFELSVLKFK